MIFEIPEGLRGLNYYQGLSLILWMVVIGLLWLAFILFLLKIRTIELKSLKRIDLGYGIFCLCFGFTRLFFIIGVYVPDAYDFYTNLGYIVSIVGMIYWLYVVETFLVPKTHRLFMYIMIVAFGISMVALIGPLSRDMALLIIWILLPFAGIALAMLYIYIIIKTTGTVRKRAEYLLVGFIIVFIGHLMDSEVFVSALPFIPLEIAPVVMIVGLLLFFTPQLKKYE